jgi:hypothetical protein
MTSCRRRSPGPGRGKPADVVWSSFLPPVADGELEQSTKKQLFMRLSDPGR